MRSLRAGELLRKAATVAVVGAALGVAGCQDAPKHLKPLGFETIAAMKSKGVTKSDPILIRIFKESSDLEIWKRHEDTGKFRLIKNYKVCAWSGELGPKHKEGDRQSPEGFYTITPGLMNPNSSYHLSFNTGFPNTFDRAHGRTGSALMVHGACSSRGCYAMTDEQVQEIYGLARDAFKGGQRAFQVQIFPFRMTPENLARHHDNKYMPFWKMLKEGSDHFEVTGVPPKVGVCGRRYVFNAGTDGLNPVADCPEDLQVAPEIVAKVQEKAAEDEIQIAAILNGGGNPGFDPGFPWPADPINQGLPAGTMLAEAPTQAPTNASPVSSFAPILPVNLPAGAAQNGDFDSFVEALEAGPLDVLPRARMDGTVRIDAVGSTSQFAPANAVIAEAQPSDRGVRGWFGRLFD